MLVFTPKQVLCTDMQVVTPFHLLAHGRHMPGYPRIDIGNDYLMARYDGAILDGQVCCLYHALFQGAKALSPLF